ncbi:MAG: hypothetical protein ACREJ5_16760 [Geminicoccaceae bacterium]
MVRDFGAKLRITALALGCASQKDLCARFREVNSGTTFELERSYKWMQGRALPRSARLYEDWAALLDMAIPITHLQSCTVDEFLELVCDRHQVSRDALATRAGIVAAALPDDAPAEGPHDARIETPRHRHLVGAYVCYAHPWSSFLEGKIVRSSLVIAPAEGGRELHATATYSELVSLGRVQLSCPVRVVNRSICLDLIDADEEFRLSMCLLVPGALASVLAGVLSGASWVDASPEPAATRIVMIRVPGATAAALEAANRYFDPPEPLSGGLAALGIPGRTSAGLDALLDGFLRGDHARNHIKVNRSEYAELALAVDRLFIESGLKLRGETEAPGRGRIAPPPTPQAPLPVQVRRSSQATVRLVRG